MTRVSPPYVFDYAAMVELSNDLQKNFPPEVQSQLNTPQLQQVLYYLSRNMGYGLLILSGFIALAAVKLNDWWWLAFRFVGFYVMAFIAIIYAQGAAS